MQKIHYNIIEGKSPGYLALFGLLGLIVLVGLYAAFTMEIRGHIITGMNNSIVWGTPHVFAVFLIVAASGALNVASIATVFGRYMYKPLGRLSALVAIALLTGGLAVLVLDLGQPMRGVLPFIKLNFMSIFSWNMWLYSGFFIAVGIYLWMDMEPRMNKYHKPAGFLAFFWRLTLTTGTGSIFGFLVARPAYDAAIMAPMFIIMSFLFGLAIFNLVLLAAYNWTKRPLGDAVIGKLRNLLGIFAGAVLYFTVVQHISNLYVAEHAGVERFILLEGGIITNMFWIGHVLIGTVIPIALVYLPMFNKSRLAFAVASLLAIIGGLAQVYVIIIGGQAYPLEMFPDKIISSSFQDGQVMNYSASMLEVLLGIGGFAIALIIIVFGIKILPFMATSLADADVDPRLSGDDSKSETAPDVATS